MPVWLVLRPILGRVPVWVWVVIAVLAWGGWQRHRAQSAERVHTRAVAAAAAAREAQLQADAAETARRLAEQERIANDARQKAAAQAADALRARTAEQQLRARLAAITADRGAGAASAPGGSQTAAQAADLLADVLGRCVSRVRELAEYADAASTAGEACQRSYDALSNR